MGERDQAAAYPCDCVAFSDNLSNTSRPPHEAIDDCEGFNERRHDAWRLLLA
eukprot:CAMPEP_0198333646 /NCGR_PEP_ID=MMETSP1450-20131203/19080_1 /TAXON_ID=753684 ORGANISM="Madagascaria erythrocladiodes, Strain CCMP3234" /NCGR_SAMPLE_ID=MMETSP1450 /ASSEMBLY_ACC=CAM_ASM_001115 /LENGTH=51 /DNA_ID=CAMNT_0044038175 /DNA_START=705 /DNA_END=857 /DNA_ORIENTATION=+